MPVAFRALLFEQTVFGTWSVQYLYPEFSITTETCRAFTEDDVSKDHSWAGLKVRGVERRIVPGQHFNYEGTIGLNS